jgi:solute carrier family 25 folate transporter 32
MNTLFVYALLACARFLIDEYLKRFLRERRNATDDAVTDIIVASIAAKFVATTVSYPHEVLRSRLQDLTVAPLAPSPWPSSGSRSKSLDKHRTTGSQSKDMAAEIPEQKQQLRRGLSLWTVAKTLVRDEGVLALWTGLRVNLIRVVPATITTFLSYEYLSKLLNSMKYLKD